MNELDLGLYVSEDHGVRPCRCIVHGSPDSIYLSYVAVLEIRVRKPDTDEKGTVDLNVSGKLCSNCKGITLNTLSILSLIRAAGIARDISIKNMETYLKGYRVENVASKYNYDVFALVTTGFSKPIVPEVPNDCKPN